MDNVTIFDRAYTPEKAAEALAVMAAVQSFSCPSCRCFYECANNPNFIFPDDTFCGRAKAEILKNFKEERDRAET